VSKYGRHPICTAEIRRGKKKERKKQDENIMSTPHLLRRFAVKPPFYYSPKVCDRQVTDAGMQELHDMLSYTAY